MVRVLGAASLPTLKSGPHRRTVVLAAGFISFVMTVLAIFAIDLIGQMLSDRRSGSRDDLVEYLDSNFPRTRRLVARVIKSRRPEPISLDS